MADKEEILKYLQNLGKAVTGCLNESGEVKDIIKFLEEQGLHLNLSFVAMISGSKPLAFPVSWAGKEKELKFEITEEDREFLASLGIKYDEKIASEKADNAPEESISGDDETQSIDREEEEEE